MAVEEKDEELSDNENPRWRSFQSHYEEEVAADIHMVKHGGGSPAIAGCLSHGHFNCVCRNIICGMPGCECQDINTWDFGQCKLSSPIWDAQGE